MRLTVSKHLLETTCKCQTLASYPHCKYTTLSNIEQPNIKFSVVQAVMFISQFYVSSKLSLTSRSCQKRKLHDVAPAELGESPDSVDVERVCKPACRCLKLTPSLFPQENLYIKGKDTFLSWVVWIIHLGNTGFLSF